MARKTGIGANERHALPGVTVGTSVQERRLATPSPDLMIIKIGERREKLVVPPSERASGVLARLAKAISKPGLDRADVFLSNRGRPVYAYSVYPKDPTKLVREDVSGQKVIGRFRNGRFYRTSSAKAF